MRFNRTVAAMIIPPKPQHTLQFSDYLDESLARVGDGPEKAEVKSSMMVWDGKRFTLHFQCVKQAKHDVLYLAWMTSRGVHVFLHDGKAGLSTHGKPTEASGKDIVFYSIVDYTVPSAAEMYLLKCLKWHRLPYLAFVAFGPGDAQRVLARAN